MERKIAQTVTGFRTKDGAGVNLVRVLGNGTVDHYDPILLLDSFDSTDPSEYIAGFPMHPHRGIETISYVYRGKMTHRDSLGNEDTIGDGEVQWMTAGSGIMHEEKLPASDRLLGVQLWLNLPARNKMVPPAYHSIKNTAIQDIPVEHGLVRLLAGSYEGKKGFMSSYLPLDYYDIHLEPEGTVTINIESDRSLTVFTLLGEACIGNKRIKEKTAVKLLEGDRVTLRSADQPCHVLWVSSKRLNEPFAWGGPIVMNTKAELNKAFDDLRNGTFLRQAISY